MLITKRIAHIAKYTQFHMDEVLKPYNLSTGLYPFLLELDKDEGINLDRISKRVNVDKAMSTRSVQKLIDLSYIEKQTDSKDCRACQLYLTKQSRELIPTIRAEIAGWIKEITVDLSKEEVLLFDKMLAKILYRADKMKN